MSVRVASCAYPIEAPETFAQFAQKQTTWVEAAVSQGAQLLVFPEYGAVEVASTLPAAERGDLQRQLLALQPLLPPLLELYAALSEKHRVYILRPSFPEFDPATGRYHNRARLHTPSRHSGVVEKLQMTRFESEVLGIAPGRAQQVFDTELGAIGVAICYDSEFPLIVRRQVELGAQLILVPSCTSTLAGYHRVALSCRARALENQCFVAHAPTLGQLRGLGSAIVEENHGAAAIFGPVDYGFPEDGVISRGAFDTPGWVMADLEFGALAQIREQGQVRNHRDWQTAGHQLGLTSLVRLW